LSSTADGQGSFAVDDQIRINGIALSANGGLKPGVNVFDFVGQSVTGFFNVKEPQDVTLAISSQAVCGGPFVFEIELTDFGVLFGNTPLFLVVFGDEQDQDGDGSPGTVDCDDANPEIHPFAQEDCNLIDDNCDGQIDEGLDLDGDGFTPCQAPDADCDDADVSINPDATELPGNNVDENCDGSLGACDPNAEYANHGEFVRCVTSECEGLVADGLLTEDECNALANQAAKSGIGKGNN